ncbi:MAG: stalk domain-containing protein [Caldisericia bacterium]|nr:stalk domain-containing protein [Caldisericia bacterium]
MKKLISFLSVLCIAFFAFMPSFTVSAADTKVFLKPVEEKIYSETEFSIQIHIQEVEKLWAMGLDVLYDNEKVTFLKAEQGNFLSSDQTTVLMPIKNREDEGRIVFGISRTKDSPGMDGTGIIATFFFKALATGDTVLGIDNLILKDPALMDIKATTESLNLKILEKDIDPPVLTVEPVAPTYAEKVTIIGKTEPKAIVKVDDKEVTVEENGSFKYEVTLKTGDNVFNITSQDKVGNITKVSLTITRKKPVIIQLTIGKKQVFVNGLMVAIEAAPFVDKASGRTLIPIRIVVESIEGQIFWEAKTQKVTLKKDDITIDLWIGKPIAQINGIPTPIDIQAPKLTPMIVSGRTFLPLRFVAENLGAKVDYEAKTQTITVTYPKL